MLLAPTLQMGTASEAPQPARGRAGGGQAPTAHGLISWFCSKKMPQTLASVGLGIICLVGAWALCSFSLFSVQREIRTLLTSGKIARAGLPRGWSCGRGADFRDQSGQGTRPLGSVVPSQTQDST